MKYDFQNEMTFYYNNMKKLERFLIDIQNIAMVSSNFKNKLFFIKYLKEYYFNYFENII